MLSNYYLLNRNINENDIWVKSYKVPEAYDWNYSDGISIKNTNTSGELFYQNNKSLKTDYVAGIQSFPVVSKKFKELLENLNDPLEFHHVKLVQVISELVDNDYYFLNILENIECFDWDNSEYEKLPVSQAPTDVEKLVLETHKIGKRNIIRIAELQSLILVSDNLRNLIESCELTGIEFQNIENYQEFEL